MSVRQVALVFVSVVGLGGCAAPALTNGDYGAMAYRLSAIHQCSAQGLMSPDIAAIGRQSIQNRIDRSKYDSDLMARALRRHSSVKFTEEDCRTTAINIIRVENQRNQQRQDRQETNEALRSATESIRAATPKQTYCNKIGNQVFCSTY